MADMLVKLYDLPPLMENIEGVHLRRALVPEKHIVVNWVRSHFSEFWASETDVAFSNRPVSCFVAVANEEMIGFACYDVTCKAFFGPTGVGEAARGRGVGKALMLLCLHDMFAQGYAYAIIGSAGPMDFYSKIVGAIVIPDSTPGIYRGLLRK
jgi:ribosomal protein S18 acetylase RimI-like enzyme